LKLAVPSFTDVAQFQTPSGKPTSGAPSLAVGLTKTGLVGLPSPALAQVLIVVDEPDTLLTLRRDLEVAGHQTALAADADTALKRLATRHFDAVALDVMMPVGDGWTVLLRMAEMSMSPPVIVVSARASAADLERARQLGAVGSIAAPFTVEDLDRAVRAAVAGLVTEGP